MSKRKYLGCNFCVGCLYASNRGCECPQPCDDGSLYTSGKTPNQNRQEVGVDMVNHPDHYKTKNGLETIDVIEAFTDGLNGIEASDTANIIKYACRWKKKNGIEDLRKIRWYVNHLIKHLDPEDGVEHVDDNIDNYFKCPKCGGNIKRDMVPVGSTNYVLPSEPYCVDCEIRYEIRINEDLSYEMKELDVFGFKTALSKRD